MDSEFCDLAVSHILVVKKTLNEKYSFINCMKLYCMLTSIPRKKKKSIVCMDLAVYLNTYDHFKK